MIALVERLDDRFWIDRDGSAARIVNRLRPLPVAGTVYALLCAFLLIAGPAAIVANPDGGDVTVWSVLAILAIAAPFEYFLLVLTLWAFAGREHIAVDGEGITVQRRVPVWRGRRRHFPRERVRGLSADPYTRPWWRVPSNDMWATLEYHGLIRGCVVVDLGDDQRRFGSRLDEEETERLIALVRQELRR